MRVIDSLSSCCLHLPFHLLSELLGLTLLLLHLVDDVLLHGLHLVAGFLLALTGPGWALFVNFLTYLLVVVVLIFIRARTPQVLVKTQSKMISEMRCSCSTLRISSCHLRAASISLLSFLRCSILRISL